MALVSVAFQLIMFKPLEQLDSWHSQIFDYSINAVACFKENIIIGVTMAMSISFKVTKRSLRYMLNKIGPSTEPLGTS